MILKNEICSKTIKYVISIKIEWFAAQSPCICQSLTAVSIGLQCSLRAVSVNFTASSLQTHGDSNAITRRLYYESQKNFGQVESTANASRLHCECAEAPQQMHWNSTAKALKRIVNTNSLRWDCAETQKCSIRWRVAVKVVKVRERNKIGVKKPQSTRY